MPPHQETPTPAKSIVVPFDAGTSPTSLKPLRQHEVPERWHTVDRSTHAPTSWPSTARTARSGLLPRS